MSTLKIGDLVKIKGVHNVDENMTCIITNLSEPSPQFPYQVASVIIDDRIYEGILVQFIEKI